MMWHGSIDVAHFVGVADTQKCPKACRNPAAHVGDI
jgi:hypothetical protein